jgi:tetratricopeptide (TPR) repeat protein
LRTSHFVLILSIALAVAPVSSQHASHRLAVVPLEIVQRPVTLRTRKGRAHHAAVTSSKEAQALYDQGLAYLHSYVWIEAARSFNSALRADQNLALAHVGLSVAYTELSRAGDARKAIDAARARALNLSDHDRRHVDVRALQMLAEDAPGDAAKLTAYRVALDDAIRAFPKDVEFVLLRGMAESPDAADRGQGSVSSSITYYDRALALSPGDFAAHHYLAHAHENTGHFSEALDQAAAFAKLAPDVPHARHMHGHSLRRLGRVHEAIVEFEAADRAHRAYAKQEQIPAEYDWHFEHNLGLLGTSLQHAGQMKRAESLLKASFALPTNSLVQAFNKREWPMFLRARGRYQDAERAAQSLIANPNPVVQATGHIEAGFAMLAQNRWGDAASASNAALRLLRTAPGGVIAANALQALQGELNLRTAARAKGRAILESVVKKMRAAPGPDAWSQTLFALDAMARAARQVGDWELAGHLAQQLIEHDPSYGGSHYAMALVAEHDGDSATAAREFALAIKSWAKADAELPELVESRQKVGSRRNGN